MTRQIEFGAVSPLQFGSYVQAQVIFREDGVVVRDLNISFDAYEFSTVYDAQNPNNVAIHFGNGHTITVNNKFDLYTYAGTDYANPKDLVVAYIPEVMQYTT